MSKTRKRMDEFLSKLEKNQIYIVLMDSESNIVGFAVSKVSEDKNVAANIYNTECKLVKTLPRMNTTITQLVEILVNDRVKQYVS